MKKVVSKVFLAVAFLSFGFAHAQNGNGNGNNFTVENFSTSEPWTDMVTNDCNGEVVSLSGTLHTNTQVKVYKDANGNIVNVKTNTSTNLSNVSGTGSLGNSYSYSFNYSRKTVDPSNGPLPWTISETYTENGVLVSQGSAPNAQIKVIYDGFAYIYVNADNELVFDIDETTDIVKDDCPGSSATN